MDMEYTDRVLKFEKELSELDRLVIDFVRVLDKSGTSYVIVSGYIAILLGRSRTTEDVVLDQDKFKYYLKEMHIRNSVIKDALGDDLEV